ncbi:MAG: hypothetical protein F6K47_34470 [Symploca sp. SIO2E6]|nr:hypothetical protein [Symploca sp. SIO2E6]
MVMQNQKSSENSLHVGDRLLAGLTQQEVAQLLDALFRVMLPELQAQAIAQLSPDTQKTVWQLLSLPQTHESTQTNNNQTVSLAKQAQTWSKLWKNWDKIVSEASKEEGKYIAQEAHWEPPYFDAITFTEDLETVAGKMLPLLPTAFEHEFTPDCNFVTALLEAEAEVAVGLPEWDIFEGLFIERQLTHCVLQWEWLTVQAQEKNAFYFAQQILEYEQQFDDIELDSDAIFDFFAQLPEADRQCIFNGLTAEEETSLWQEVLKNIDSHWHYLYLNLVEQYAPHRYLDNLRETIPQQWQNGSPIIETLLSQKNYAESLVIIEETLQALLKSYRVDTAWTPETSLLATTLGFYDISTKDVGMLLHYYQQTAQELNQTERAKALEIQQLAIAQWFNWSTMFTAFAEIPVSASTQEALFVSWRDYIARRAKPRTRNEYGTVKIVDSWWVIWLLDSIADTQKGVNWFQQQINQWITNLPGDKTQLGENYDLLRLLTKDLTEVRNNELPSYPRFYEVVIRPEKLSSKDELSRREYLKQYAPADLWEQVMKYWKTNLQDFVPKPELAQGSNYTEHARWMIVLKKLSPQDYETLLAQWQVVHKRRRNLWKAMTQVGLNF